LDVQHGPSERSHEWGTLVISVQHNADDCGKGGASEDNRPTTSRFASSLPIHGTGRKRHGILAKDFVPF
jgi:hypothetical protein